MRSESRGGTKNTEQPAAKNSNGKSRSVSNLLYKGTQQLRIPQSHANLGLWYDKFGDRWYLPSGSSSQFNKDEWIDEVVGQGSRLADRELISEAVERQAQMIDGLGGIVLRLRNESRFVTGLGRPHPVENGFAWHHTLGVPYLPGSGLKGVLRDWMSWTRDDDSSSKKRWFGEPDSAGEVVFLDLLPVSVPQLCRDILTPHYAEYYRGLGTADTPPGDWMSPIPISFLAVERDQEWQCGVVPRGEGWRSEERKQIESYMDEALKILGFGAKSSVGYGCFSIDRPATARVQRELEEARQKAAEAERFRRETAGLSDIARAFYEQSRNEVWETDKNAFWQSVTNDNWLDRLEKTPDLDAIHRLRILVDKHFPGLLKNPDLRRGRNDRFRFKEGQRAFAHRLNQLSHAIAN